MNRRIIWLLILLLGLVVYFVSTGNLLSQKTVFTLGTLGIGFFILIIGLQTFIKKEIGYKPKSTNYGPTSLFTGLAAQLYGLLFITFAILGFSSIYSITL